MNNTAPALGVLTQDELKRVEEALWKLAQAEAFPEELQLLKKSQGPPVARRAVVRKSSPIYKTWPYMDEAGVLRMRGRIGAASFAPYEARYPTILPKQHRVTLLIVDWFHCQFRHANREIVVNEIQQRFEIPKLRRLVEKIARGCIWCKVMNANPKPPVMAPMPKARLTPFVRPFTSVGLDYFGPLFVKVGRSQAKRWIALFTCLSIRAVYMEVVYNLSIQSYLMAVQRFMARRGTPAEFYTDNGTCFKGASKEFVEEITARNEALATKFASAKIAWKFIPPAAPHMGGAWERLVRSVKVAIGSLLDAPRKPDDEV